MTIESHLYRLNRYLNIFAQSSELSAARLQVLNIIKEKNPITLRKLCDIQEVKMPTMSKLVDELQNDALVFRAQSKDDARQRWIVPTQKGIQVLIQAQQDNQDKWGKLLAGLDAKELETIEANIALLNQRLSGFLNE